MQFARSRLETIKDQRGRVMSLQKTISLRDAVSLVQDGDTLATSGYGGSGVPEQLIVALEERFLETGKPENLTLMYAGGQGDGKERGLNHLGHEKLLKRVVGGHYGLIPKIERLAVENKIEAYNLPEGVITHLYRDVAAGKPGTLSNVGIGTFVDPRLEGGKVNAAAQEDIVELVNLDGEDTLFFKSIPVNVAFIRGTTADPDGNITLERETLRLETLAMALAAHNSGGIVICQVERVAEAGSLDARRVRIPGALVDAVVIAEPEFHMQTYGTQYNAAYSGEVRVPLSTLPKLPLDEKKVILRRAAAEIPPNSIVNLGVGMPENIGIISGEERIQDLITLTIDPGVFGGVPMGGLDFGAATNFSASIDHPYQFDFIDGGGLDVAVLGFAECDGRGNVNASRFGKRLAGCGGFINITQNSKKVVFIGTFTSGGLKAELKDGKVIIHQEGKFSKFVDNIGQVTFSGEYASARDKEVFYVTERCVFRLQGDALELVEVAPGIDLDSQILDLLPFTPLVNNPVRMDEAIFRQPSLNLRQKMLDLNIEDRLTYDAKKNTIFMDYSGMHVRSTNDLEKIREAVDNILSPVGKKVLAVVNYERFQADEGIMDAYLDLVRYVEETYYLKVSRYTTSGFMRLKMASGLEKRALTSDVYSNIQTAVDSL